MKILIENGAKINALDNDRSTPLHHAAMGNKNTEVVKILIESGANVNAQNNDKLTPLHFAAIYQNAEVM